jgi:hypothetical protein
MREVIPEFSHYPFICLFFNLLLTGGEFRRSVWHGYSQYWSRRFAGVFPDYCAGEFPIEGIGDTNREGAGLVGVRGKGYPLYSPFFDHFLYDLGHLSYYIL